MNRTEKNVRHMMMIGTVLSTRHVMMKQTMSAGSQSQPGYSVAEMFVLCCKNQTQYVKGNHVDEQRGVEGE